MQSAAAFTLMPLLIFFAAYIAAVIQNAFQWPGNPIISPSPRRTWAPSNTWFPGPTRVTQPNGISTGSTVFAVLTNVTNRQTDTQTDHATPSVAIGHIWLLLRCGQKLANTGDINL